MNELKHGIPNLEKEKRITTRARLYVDGACIRNGRPNSEMGVGIVAYFWPGDMSWAEAAEAHEDGRLTGEWPKDRLVSMGAGTNNRAELLAIQLGLEMIPDRRRTGVVVLTDSEYCQKVLNPRGRPRENLDLVRAGRRLVKECAYCYINWVRGHDRCEDNIRADLLAKEAIEAKR